MNWALIVPLCSKPPETGRDRMNVGMVIQAPVMGMQNRGHADIGSQIFGIYAG